MVKDEPVELPFKAALEPVALFGSRGAGGFEMDHWTIQQIFVQFCVCLLDLYFYK